MTRSKTNSAPLSEDTHFFGKQAVDGHTKTSLVGDVFSRVAAKYDVMNDAMSFGLHRLWKDLFVQIVLRQDMSLPVTAAFMPSRLPIPPDQTWLDLAGGTGDIAFRLAKALQRKNPDTFPRIIVSDINPDMLAVGKARAMDNGLYSNLEWLEVNAESVPLPDASVDKVTMAFGLRNVTNRAQALSEIRRVLKAGGQFYCLEFSPLAANNPLQSFYRLYSDTIIPKLGEMIAGDKDSYEYLVESIRQFPAPLELAGEMEAAGFAAVRSRPLNGGIVCIHRGVALGN